ncbi:MAG: hypothetical protein RLZZ53_184, partial [Acidobacteriota bacterium]
PLLQLFLQAIDETVVRLEKELQ